MAFPLHGTEFRLESVALVLRGSELALELSGALRRRICLAQRFLYLRKRCPGSLAVLHEVPESALVGCDHTRDRVRVSPKARRPGGDECGVEVDVAEQSVAGKPFR